MNKQQLASKIWESANKMRSKIEANEYKDYILGFIFYKFLSETEVARLKARDFAEEDLPSLVEDDEETVEFVKGECGYFIAYDNLFSTWVAKGGDFEISNVRDALSAFSLQPQYRSCTQARLRRHLRHAADWPLQVGYRCAQSVQGSPRPHLPHQGHPDGRSPGL